MTNRYFTKFCGITTTQDAINAEIAGCNAIGFVFVKKSKRYISVEKCNEICKNLSPAILLVGLFANNTESEVNDVINSCNLHVLQFHGSETEVFCNKWQKPYWKAVPMADKINPIEYAKSYKTAQGFLIDNYGTKKSGGSGDKFDWLNLPKQLGVKWILAGGLNPENIKQAKQTTEIKNFDVSSGIEKSPGIKSQTKMNNFIKQLND